MHAAGYISGILEFCPFARNEKYVDPEPDAYDIERLHNVFCDGSPDTCLEEEFPYSNSPYPSSGPNERLSIVLAPDINAM